ncbi:MAG TPA: YitT family protein [Candidatus Copromonas faecavium]|uniref:YitT family protein n=1 Tax=Candidatus Copromonas faecavium (nom. illeg.) TaxID=2840740 RepID=A0A9D1D5T0_9FIRM|nr:YitT family protein [Candidatus Copromonas faecavium]
METTVNQKQKYRKLAVKILTILVGLTCYAIGTALFVLPSDMIAAGTTGLALLAEHYWGLPLSVFVAAFNVLMFLLGLAELGKEFALSTLIATFYYPFALDQAIRIVGDWVFTEDPMLCAIFAGLMIGFSLGIVIRAGASTGGMDIPPLVLRKRLGIPVSVSMYAFDFVILLTQLTFRDKEKILYGLIMVMIYTVVLDKVLMMGTRQMQVKIISERYEEISEMIQKKLDRGTTLLHIEGGHLKKPSKAVLSVVSARELSKLNSLVMELDENAFMIINQVGEVHGRGFTLTKKYT